MPLAVFAAALLAATAAPPAPPSPCALVDRDFVAATQKARIVATKESRGRSSVVDRRACYYQADPLASSVSLEWTADAAPGGARGRWREIFHGDAGESRKEREEAGERPKSPPAPVAGVGDEAFWVGNPASGAIYALAGSSFVRVSVGGPGKESEKRERAREIAARAVAAIRREGKTPDRTDSAPAPDLR